VGGREADRGNCFGRRALIPRQTVFPSERLTPADAAVLETFVVPRYLALYGQPLLEMVLESESPRIAHLGCRTGYPDRKLFERMDNASLIGLDPSLPALELARNKAAVLGDVAIEYHVTNSLPCKLESEQCSHVLSLHPNSTRKSRTDLFREMARLLYSGGQALVVLPLRGSFQEVADLFREYALKYDDGEFAKAVDTAFAARPSLEGLSEELEQAGLEDVDVDVRSAELSFDSGRAFMEDPASRLLILPEVRTWLGAAELTEPLEYLRDAVDKYWSEGQLGLSLNVGCASARKP
jgi:SAM-dependent methyltransferase